eukprot:152948-Ditylum_brightwellii.AAC.1
MVDDLLGSTDMKTPIISSTVNAMVIFVLDMNMEWKSTLICPSHQLCPYLYVVSTVAQTLPTAGHASIAMKQV